MWTNKSSHAFQIFLNNLSGKIYIVFGKKMKYFKLSSQYKMKSFFLKTQQHSKYIQYLFENIKKNSSTSAR